MAQQYVRPAETYDFVVWTGSNEAELVAAAEGVTEAGNVTHVTKNGWLYLFVVSIYPNDTGGFVPEVYVLSPGAALRTNAPLFNRIPLAVLDPAGLVPYGDVYVTP